jgi:hypothetical protein
VDARTGVAFTTNPSGLCPLAAGEATDMSSKANAPQRPTQRELVIASLLKAPDAAHDAKGRE